MECRVCERSKRILVCRPCMRTQRDELRVQIKNIRLERRELAEKAARLLGDGLGRERWARAQEFALEERITMVQIQLGIRTELNSNAKERVRKLRRVLNERHDNLVSAQRHLSAPKSLDTHTTAFKKPLAPLENKKFFPPARDTSFLSSRLARLFYFPTSSAPVRPKDTTDPLTEARQSLEEIRHALARARSVHLKELADIHVGQVGMPYEPVGEDRVAILRQIGESLTEDLVGLEPIHLQAALRLIVKFICLASFYLNVELPFVVEWGDPSGIVSPFKHHFVPVGVFAEESSRSSITTPIGAVVPWIVAGRGLNSNTTGGWERYTTPLALYSPDWPHDNTPPSSKPTLITRHSQPTFPSNIPSTLSDRTSRPVPASQRPQELSAEIWMRKFVTALTMLQYNAAYLVWMRERFSIPDRNEISGTSQLVDAVIRSEGIDPSLKVAANTQETLSQLVSSFPLSFDDLLARNIEQVSKLELARNSNPNDDDEEEWDLI